MRRSGRSTRWTSRSTTTPDRYTILRIESQDTIGFLYEFTNALALNGIHIARVSVATEGSRVQDTL